MEKLDNKRNLHMGDDLWLFCHHLSWSTCFSITGEYKDVNTVFFLIRPPGALVRLHLALWGES